MHAQTGPKCNGEGTVGMPPNHDGDVPFWVDNVSGGYTCKVCNGSGIIYVPE